jgi:hypothetical protein
MALLRWHGDYREQGGASASQMLMLEAVLSALFARVSIWMLEMACASFLKQQRTPTQMMSGSEPDMQAMPGVLKNVERAGQGARLVQ